MFKKLELGVILGVLLNDFVSSDELIDLTEPEPTLSDKIVNGQNVDPPFKYSWMASIQHGNNPYCGGVMIATNALITARHCSIKGDNEEYKVLIHRHDLWKSNKEEDGIELDVLERIYHPDADIALWKLSPSYNHTQDAIMLFPNGTDIKGPETGEIATALGWGRTGYNSKSAHILQEVQVPLVDPKKCESVWNNRRNVKFRSAIQVCAGWSEGERDTCKGDSGGPLFVMRGKVPMIVGLTSFGDPCAKPDTPTVYSKVEPFIEWLIKHMNNPITSTVKPVIGSSQAEISELIQEDSNLDDDHPETTGSSANSSRPALTDTVSQIQTSSATLYTNLPKQPTHSGTSIALSPSKYLESTSKSTQINEKNISDLKLDNLQKFINLFLEKSKNSAQASTSDISRNPPVSHTVNDLDLKASSKKTTSISDSQSNSNTNNFNNTQDFCFELSTLLSDEKVRSEFDAILESIQAVTQVSQFIQNQDEYYSDDTSNSNSPNEQENSDKNVPGKQPVKPPTKPKPTSSTKPLPKPPATITVTQTVKPACTPSTVVSTSMQTNTVTSTATATKTITSEVATTVTATLTVTVTATPTDPPEDDPDSDSDYDGEVPYNIYTRYKDYHGAK